MGISARGASLIALMAISASACGLLPFAAKENTALVEFRSRVEDYIDLHRSLAEHSAALLIPDSRPEEINASRRRLAAALGRARANAMRGDVFVPRAEGYFRERIRGHFRGPDGTRAMLAVTEVQPRSLVVGVNSEYRQELLLPTMPPGLLGKLPSLPDEMQYRIVHGSLLLLDTHARLIVDFIPDVLPHPRAS